MLLLSNHYSHISVYPFLVWFVVFNKIFSYGPKRLIAYKQVYSSFYNSNNDNDDNYENDKDDDNDDNDNDNNNSKHTMERASQKPRNEQ